MSYPQSGLDYTNYTLRNLDVFAWRAAKSYSKVLPSRAGSSTKPSVIVLHDPSNLEYLITLLVLTKLGHLVLFLSTCPSVPAIESLMKTTSASTIIGDETFVTLPLLHNHGICDLFRAIYSLKSIHLYNAGLPLTQEYLIGILSQNQFEVFYGVPYALKLLSETPRKIEVLGAVKIVMYGVSACPDDLGNLLVENGVHLVSHYGAQVPPQRCRLRQGAGYCYGPKHRNWPADDIFPTPRRQSLELCSENEKGIPVLVLETSWVEFI